MSNKQLNVDNIDRIDQLNYEPLERKYIKVQILGAIFFYIILMALPWLILLADDFSHRTILLVVLEFLTLIIGVIHISLLPKAFTYKGFAIREHDITYRSGIFFPSVVTIPFCKIQQVSIQQNPISRIFNLYSVDVVNGAQMLAETSIPGLTEKKANEIKALLTERVKMDK